MARTLGRTPCVGDRLGKPFGGVGVLDLSEKHGRPIERREELRCLITAHTIERSVSIKTYRFDRRPVRSEVQQ